MNTDKERDTAWIGDPVQPARIFGADDFSRLDESDDALFYARDRFVQHLDSLALATVEHLIGQLIVTKQPAILDLMASWDSHIPTSLQTAEMVGLGMNANELERNPALNRRLIHDLNKDPHLPLPECYFDAVLNTVSVDYMTAPFEIFCEVGRILKPGGLFLVTFSNRMFPQKVTRIWRESTEEERVLLVKELFQRSRLFEDLSTFISTGKPRPADDKYAHLGIPSDPVYAVYAWKQGASETRATRPVPTAPSGEP
jgi:SAM-dependent methyltransferase